VSDCCKPSGPRVGATEGRQLGEPESESRSSTLEIKSIVYEICRERPSLTAWVKYEKMRAGHFHAAEFSTLLLIAMHVLEYNSAPALCRRCNKTLPLPVALS